MTDNDHNKGFASGKLRSLVERVERLTEEKDTLATDIREIYVEAKSAGFDTKIMRKLVQRRKLDKAARQEADALLELYESVFG